jgi:hypothetical protein
MLDRKQTGDSHILWRRLLRWVTEQYFSVNNWSLCSQSKDKTPSKTLLSMAGWISPDPSRFLHRRIVRRLKRYAARASEFG